MNPPQANRGVLQRNCLLCFGACAGTILLVPLAFLLFILFFYAEEDWRGARAWEQAKKDIAAQGESIDPAKFIPAPVPDAENFGALSYFKIVTGPGGLTGRGWQRFAISDSLKNVTDNIAMSADASSDGKLPYLGNWAKGEPPDSHDFTGRMLAFLKQEQPNTKAPDGASPFQIFELICPSLADLRSALDSHPACVFQEPIDYQNPVDQTFGAATSALSLDKALMYDARLAIMAGHGDIALQDLRVGWRVVSGVQKRPFYVANLVAAGIIAIQLRMIEEELSASAWDDEQVRQIENDLGKIDYLAKAAGS